MAYRHVRPRWTKPLRCPVCGTARARFHSWRRVVEHPDPDQPTYLSLPLAEYACGDPACPRKYFTRPLPEAAPHARSSRRLRRTAACGSYCWPARRSGPG